MAGLLVTLARMPLDDLARQMAARPEPPAGRAPLIAMHLAVLVGRLMPSVGWVAAEPAASARTSPVGGTLERSARQRVRPPIHELRPDAGRTVLAHSEVDFDGSKASFDRSEAGSRTRTAWVGRRALRKVI